MSRVKASWRCRHGFHAWRFVSMSDNRTIDASGHLFHVCNLVERCARCRLRRSNPYAAIPKRVRMEEAR